MEIDYKKSLECLCKKCGETKKREFFSKGTSKYGTASYCKECMTKYRDKTKEKRLDQMKKYYKKNKKEMSNNMKEWYKKNNYLKVVNDRRKTEKGDLRREWERNYNRERMKNEPSFKILCRTRIRICKALNGTNKSIRTRKLIGCTVEKYKEYLESLFLKGMSWDNYGKIWDIDHIVPCNFFDLTKENHLKACFNYSNTQPMWKGDNASKGANLSAIVPIDPTIFQ